MLAIGFVTGNNMIGYYEFEKFMEKKYSIDHVRVILIHFNNFSFF